MILEQLKEQVRGGMHSCLTIASYSNHPRVKTLEVAPSPPQTLYVSGYLSLAIVDDEGVLGLGDHPALHL